MVRRSLPLERGDYLGDPIEVKHVVAISTAALSVAAADAGYVNTISLASWAIQGSNTGTDFPPGPGYAVESIYTDTLHNAVFSAGTVTGGHGLGQYELMPGAGPPQPWDPPFPPGYTQVFASGSADATNIGGSNTTSTPFSMRFNFSASGGPSPANFLGGVGFAFVVTDPWNSIRVDVAYAGGSATTGAYTPGAGALFVGFWSSNGDFITSVTFFGTNNPDTTLTITDIYYGLVPTPGAVALVGIAGLFGSRRRRA